METLYDAVRGYRTLSFLGMCKNAGKTTALLHCARGFWREGKLPALTSIGRDGEGRDVVTGTAKPRVYVPSGTIIATAAELLHACDVTREILAVTDERTPLGPVVIVRAGSDGYVELAGPSTVDGLARLRRLLYSLGAQQLIIDGALDRRSFCSPELTDASVLCTGASCGGSIDAVLAGVRHICELYALPRAAVHADLDSTDKYLLIDNAGARQASGDDFDAARKCAAAAISTVVIRGALTDRVAQPMLHMAEGLTIVVRDPGKILLSPDMLRRLKTAGARLEVIEKNVIAAVTLNPFSARGSHFDRAQLLARARETLPVPVFDVCAGADAANTEGTP